MRVSHPNLMLMLMSRCVREARRGQRGGPLGRGLRGAGSLTEVQSACFSAIARGCNHGSPDLLLTTYLDHAWVKVSGWYTSSTASGAGIRARRAAEKYALSAAIATPMVR